MGLKLQGNQIIERIRLTTDRRKSKNAGKQGIDILFQAGIGNVGDDLLVDILSLNILLFCIYK